MRKYFSLLMLIFILTSCHHFKDAQKTGSSPDYKKGDEVERDGNGTSIENAVVINESTETAGVNAEYSWLKENYPGYSIIEQKELSQNEKHYDKIEIKTTDGKTVTVFFDITNFFGKF